MPTNNVIAIVNQKGGVGKTTTSVNLADALGFYGEKVLLIDLDPQGNATSGSGVNKHQIQNSLAEKFLQQTENQEIIIKLKIGYDLVASTADLIMLEAKTIHHPNRLNMLTNFLKKIKSQYQYIFIDCPPTLNLLTLNALVAANKVIIPMQCEYYALEGLSALLETLNSLTQQANKNLEILGILLTMFDARNKLAQDIVNDLKKHFKKKLFNTKIPRNVRLAEAPSHGLPILHYDKKSKGAISYLNLAKEIHKLLNQK